MIRKALIYLAGPFSHTEKAIMNEREIQHAKCAIALKQQGLSIYAPITETTALEKLGGLKETSWAYWREHDLNLLSRCDELWVMLLDGYKESLGVKGEVKFAVKNSIPIKFVAIDGSYTLIKDILKEFDVKTIEELND